MLAPLVIGGLGLVGLMFQKTWSVLPLIAALVLETSAGVQLIPARASLIVLAGTTASALLLLPVLAGMARYLLGRPPSTPAP